MTLKNESFFFLADSFPSQCPPKWRFCLVPHWQGTHHWSPLALTWKGHLLSSPGRSCRSYKARKRPGFELTAGEFRQWLIPLSSLLVKIATLVSLRNHLCLALGLRRHFHGPWLALNTTPSEQGYCTLLPWGTRSEIFRSCAGSNQSAKTRH